MPIGDTELRLLWTVLLNAAVLACAFGFVSRISREIPRVQQIADTLLLTYLVQYVSVGLPGLLGILSAPAITITALIFSALLLIASIQLDRRKQLTPASSKISRRPALLQRSIFIAACVFAICYLASNVFVLRYQPVIATDALAYHFPAALHWLRTERLSLFPTWFFNPANTYSPLAGSTFIAWLMAPEGNDVIARFVQAPAMLLLFFATIQLCRQVMEFPEPFLSRDRDLAPAGMRGNALGSGLCEQSLTESISLPLAGIIGVGVIAFRPLLGEASLGKDDLFLTAFLIAGIAGFAPNRLRDPLGPWRIGIALGLCLATKYTSFLALPLFLLLADAPWRSGWRGRQLSTLLGTIALIAGPWYLRNLWLTGNPVYPLQIQIGGHTVLPGMFQTRASVDLRSLAGIRRVLTGRYHSVPLPIFYVLIVGWVAAIATTRGRMLRDPIVRIALLGPVLGLALFIAFSPYPEIRFVFSSLVLLFIACAVAISGWPRVPSWARMGFALLIAAISIATGYRAHALVAACAGFSLFAAVAGAGLYLAQNQLLHWPSRAWSGIGAGAALAVALAAYVYWNAYVNFMVGKPGDVANPGGDLVLDWWRSTYAHEADAWNFVRRRTPPGAIIAYSNTSLVYPLSSEERRAIYIPTRRGVRSLSDLPHFPISVSGEQIIPTVTALLESDTDAGGWLRRLLASRASYFVIAKNDAGSHPPEISLARDDRTDFRLIFEDDFYLIFQIRNRS